MPYPSTRRSGPTGWVSAGWCESRRTTPDDTAESDEAEEDGEAAEKKKPRQYLPSFGEPQRPEEEEEEEGSLGHDVELDPMKDEKAMEV